MIQRVSAIYLTMWRSSRAYDLEAENFPRGSQKRLYVAHPFRRVLRITIRRVQSGRAIAAQKDLSNE